MVVIVVAAGAMGTVVVLCAVLAHKYCMLFTSVYFIKFQHTSILLPAHAQLPVAVAYNTSACGIEPSERWGLFHLALSSLNQ